MDLSDVGQHEVEVVCDVAADAPIGTEFTCLATLRDGSTALIEAIVAADGDVETFNFRIVDAESVEEDLLYRVLTERSDLDLTIDGVDCGVGFLDPDGGLPCVLTPRTGPPLLAQGTFDAALTQFDYVIE